MNFCLHRAVNKLSKYLCTNRIFLFLLKFYIGKQPVINAMKDILASVSERWDEKDSQMNDRMDTLIKLQQERLEMDRLQLQFQRELARLEAKAKKGNL